MEGIKYDRAQCMANSWVCLIAGRLLAIDDFCNPQVAKFSQEVIANIAEKHRQIAQLRAERDEAREEAERLRKIVFAASERLGAMLAMAGQCVREAEQERPLGT